MGLLLVTPEVCNSFLTLVSRLIVLPSAQTFAISVDRWDSLAAAGICGLCLLYAANRAFKISADSCATELVRHTLQIWFQSWIQKYPKCKREGAAGVDGERDEFNSFTVRGNNERED